MTSTRSNDFSPIYLRSGALTLLACGPAAALMSAYHWSAHIPLVWVASSILLGGLAWLAGLKALDHVLLAELHRVASRLAPFRRALAE